MLDVSCLGKKIHFGWEKKLFGVDSFLFLLPANRKLKAEKFVKIKIGNAQPCIKHLVKGAFALAWVVLGS